MSLASMTGFAQREGAVEVGRWTWELRSVNGRGLDLKIRLPPGFDVLEAAVRAVLQKGLARGSISANLFIRREMPVVDVRLNEPLLEMLLTQARALAARHGAPAPRVESFIGVRGVLEIGETAREMDDALAQAVLDGLSDTVGDLAAARRNEGRHIVVALAGELDEIERLTSAARAVQAGRAERIRTRLAAAVAALFDASDALDPVRLHQEAMLIAARADVQEEIERLGAHAASARALLSAGEPVGRRLDFLSQELNREANTLCAKSGDAELTEVGLRLKAAIDRFREQVQNVE